MLLRFLVLSALALALSACNLSGTGEKGPFRTSSDVTFSKLDAQANPIASQTLNTNISSNNGAYSFSNIQWNGWGQLQVSGQYFNEFTATTSADVITLDAITKKDRTFDSANVHIFSHIAAARIRQRVANGQNRLNAWRDTQTEMKQLFGLNKVSRNIHRGVEQLSLLKGSGRYRKDNANLLLFTGSFLAVGGDSASLELLTTDFADDGQFNGVGTPLFNSIAVMGATDGLLGNLSSNLSNYGIGNPPNNADMATLPTWVNQDTTDDIAPVVTINGANPITIVVGTPYVDEGARATDNVDGVVTAVAINGSDVIDTSAVGTFTVTYNATDVAGNTGSATRIVEVVEAPDTEAPVIVLLGDNPETLEVDTSEVPAPYQEPGYTVTDNRDNNLNVEVIGAVQTNVLGTYILTYSAVDAAGNDVVTERTVEVVDTTDPVITLNGANAVEVVAGTAYEDAGATATDNHYGIIDVVVSGTVDIDTVGTYTLTYTAEDGSNNAATETRTVTVTEAPDTTLPTIILLGDAIVTVEAGTSYSDAGATASDNKDGDLTGNIVVGGSVNVNVPATYILTYNVQDSAPNAAVEVTRTVIVADTIAPVITLAGDSAISLVEGSNFTDAGATASDSLDGDITTNIAIGGDTVDTTTPGVYTITYNVMDNAQNPAVQVTRTITITEAPDTTPPVITLLGDASVTIEAGTSYTDAGATALDDKDGDLTGAIVVGGSVNVNVPATYILTYNVQDAAPNEAIEVTRTIIVEDTIVPTIILVGDASISLVEGTSYTDAGATASDSLDGDITTSIVTGGDTVDTTTLGVYTITYNVMDNAQNSAAQVTRTVTITEAPDTTPPVITLLGNASVTVEAGTSYSDAGATALDDKDGDLTGAIVVGGSVNVNVPATYVLTYNVQDAAPNAAIEVTRTIIVEDTIVPTITLVGDASISLVGGTSYTDAGATASDSLDGDITTSIVTGGDTVDTTTPGVYTITYNVMDNAQNPAAQVTRTITITAIPAYQIVFITDTTTVPRNLEASLFSQGLQLIASVIDGSGNLIATEPTFDPAVVDLSTPGTYPVEFSYTDPYNRTITKTLTVIVENHTPLATSASVTVDEDSANNPITLIASDANQGDTLSYTYGQPANGSVTGTAPNVVYTPDSNFASSDSFTFTVSDGIAESTGTITITVTDIAEPNTAPVATAQSVTFEEDSNDNVITLVGTDADVGDTLTYTTTPPTSGVLGGTGENITYTPNSNFFGTDSFTFTVSDGTDSSTATVNITVTDVPEPNQVPVANARLATVDEDTTDNLIVLSGLDPDGDDNALTYTISTQPLHGSLSGTAPDVIYTPSPNYAGIDEFYFTVNDGVDTSAPAKVDITVIDIIDAQAFTIAIGDVVLDGQPDIGAGNLEVPGAIDIYTFTATAGQEIAVDIQYNGGFNLGLNTYYIVKDSTGTEVINSRLDSDSSAVFALGGEYTLTVAATGDQVGTYQFQIKGPYQLVFTSNPLHVTAGTTPVAFYDLLTGNTTAVADIGGDTYIPSLTYDDTIVDLTTVGTYVLPVQHRDAQNRLVTKDITIIVDSGVVPDYQILFSQNPLYVAVGSDINDLFFLLDEEIAMVVNQHGDLVDDAFAMPDESYWEALGDLSTAGTHSIIYTYYDDFEREYVATLEVIVGATPANASPVISTLFTVSGTVGNPITINGSTFDNGNPISYDTDGTIVSYSWTENGIELSTTPIFQYTPTTVGEHRLTLKIVDNDGAFTLGTKIVNATEVPNVLPAANAGRDKTVEVNNSVYIVGSGTDNDGTITAYSWTENGTSLATTAEFDYTPTTVGTHTLTLTVTDNRNGTATDTVLVEAVAPNTPPVANAGADTSVEVNTAVTLSGSASTDDGSIISYSWSENSVLLYSSDTRSDFTYIPTSVGAHTITLTVMDDYEVTNTDTVIVTATAAEILSATCPATPTTDAAFTDIFVEFSSFDTPWPDALNNVALTVDDIANVFNTARATTDSFSLQGKKLVMPTQAVWDGYSYSQKALFLINSERCARGVLPYEGISPLVESSPAQYYADYLSSNDVFGHYEDGNSPWGRLDTFAGVITSGASANADFFSFAENLAVNSLGSTGPSPTVHEPVAKAIYAWMYADKEATKVNLSESSIDNFIYTYGHRRFILAKGLVENSGEADKEGLIGIGVSTVQTVEDGFNWTKVYTVMNAFDPNGNWPLGNIQTVDLLELNLCLDGYVNSTVTNLDGTTSLVCIFQAPPGVFN